MDSPLTVGRDCHGLVLVDQRVSRRHTSFEPIDESIQVRDLGSSNGTTVNGATITEPTIVTPGDHVTIGNTSVTFQLSDHGVSWSPSPVTELATPTDPVLKTSIELVAESMEDDNEGQAVAAEVVGGADESGTLTVVFSDIETWPPRPRPAAGGN